MNRENESSSLCFILILRELVCIHCNTLIHDDNFTCFDDRICLSENYDINKIPSKPINIDVTISIVQITEIDDVKATVDVKAWITYEWEDIRVFLRNALNILQSFGKFRLNFRNCPGNSITPRFLSPRWRPMKYYEYYS